MARKTKEEAEKTRSALLDAALDVFYDKGFVRATLDDIARAAGLTRGAIYWHFKDKVALFEALAEQIGQCTATRHEDLKHFDLPTLDALHAKVVEWLSHFEDDARFRRFYEIVNFKMEYHAELEPFLARKRAEKREVLKYFADCFRNMQQQGAMRETDPWHAALMMVTFVHGMVDIWLNDPSLFSIRETAAQLLAQFLDPFKPAVSRQDVRIPTRAPSMLELPAIVK